MPTMGKVDGNYVLEHTVTTDSQQTLTFPISNKFADSNLVIKVEPRAASDLGLEITDLTGSLDMGTATSGVYHPTASITGDFTVGTAGWITDTNNGTHHYVTDTTVALGSVNQSTLTNGANSVSSGDTINPAASAQTLTISEGYSPARTVVFGSAADGAAGEITSGTASITTLIFSHTGDTEGTFQVTGRGTVSAPTVNTAGYVSSTAGTKNANTNGATVNALIDQIGIKAVVSGNGLKKPTLSKTAISIVGVTDAASGNAQSTAPTSGVYVAVQSNQNTATVTATPSVSGAGYGTTAYYTVTSAGTATAGASASDVHYIPITTTVASVDGRTVSYGDGWISSGSSQVGLGSIQSGAGAAVITSPTWDSTNSEFTQTASGSIASPIINTAGWVSSTEGTRTGNSISGSKTLDTVQVGVTVSGTSTVTPVITRTAKPSEDTWEDAASGAATSTKPTSGAYVQVDAAAASTNLTITGKVSEEGYGTTDHYLTDTATTQAVGSNAATTQYVPITAGEVTAGSAIVSSIGFSYNSSKSNFTPTFAGLIPAPTVDASGYISNTIGRLKSGNLIVGSSSLSVPKIALGTTSSATGSVLVTPQIALDSNTNIAGAQVETTTQPASGYYIAVKSAAQSANYTVTPTVTTAGYGTTQQYTATGATKTVGATASATTYIPLTSATFANAATSGSTYTDISATAPVLISGDYLYINEGYVTNAKISLARLVPDATDANASAAYILAGYSAYDNDGTLIIGTMATYDGTYTVT